MSDGARPRAPRAAPVARPAPFDQLSWLVSALFVLILYFMAYRYPFQINNSGTSPTYSDTPSWLQAGKYALLAPLAMLGLLISRNRNGRFSALDVVCLVLMTNGLFIGAASMLDGGAGVRLVQLTFVFPVIMLFSDPDVTRDGFGKFARHLVIFFYVSLAVYALHLFNFYVFNRLPALGYYGSFPRFGGVWDDPNSAAAIFMFATPYMLAREGLTRRTVALCGLALVAVLLSQSLTTFAVVSVTFTICTVLFFTGVGIHTRLLLLAGALLATALLFLVIGFFVLQSLDLTIEGFIKSMDATLRSKQQSVSMRQLSYVILRDVSPMTLLGLEPVGDFGENEWVNLIANAGAPFTLGYAALQLSTLFILWRWARAAEPRGVRPVVVGFFSYYLWFFLLQINLPAGEIYPINMIAAVITGMAWARHLSPPSPSRSGARAVTISGHR